MTVSTSPQYVPAKLPVRVGAVPWEPVTLDEAKKRCDVAPAITGHDAELTSLLTEARIRVETDLATIAATGEFRYRLTEWPKDYIRLPVRNVAGIVKIDYTSPPDGESVEWPANNYQLVADAVWPTVWPMPGVSWPDVQEQNPAPISVTMTAGYADAGAVPETFKQAVLARIRWLFVREDESAGARRAYESIVSMARSSYP